MKKTTVKPIALGYRKVGSQDAYTPLMGVLKGLSISQDEPDSTEIEAEFYDSPFEIFYQGNPVTLTFELANYNLEELPTLFGGNIDEETDDYDGSTVAYTTEWEWKLDFARGFASLVIFKGLTIGTIKKDADGALNYSVTITALVYTDTSVTPNKDLLYKIVSGASDEYEYGGQIGGFELPTNYSITFNDSTVPEVLMDDTLSINSSNPPDYIYISGTDIKSTDNIEVALDGEDLEEASVNFTWSSVDSRFSLSLTSYLDDELDGAQVYYNGTPWFTIDVV